MPIPPSPPSLVESRFPAAPLAPALVEARRRLWFDETAGLPLETPGRLLTEYYADRRGSPLRRIVETANRWAIDLETVVLLAPCRSAEVARGVMQAAAHPFYNALGHGARGGRPRLAIVEPVDDDDLLQGVLDLVRRTGESMDRHDRWGVWIEGADDPTEGEAMAGTAALLRQALAESAKSADDAKARAWVTTSDGEPCGGFPAGANTAFSRRLDYPTLWDGGGFTAAALCGADVVGLTKGMTWFVEGLKKRAPDVCPVARLVALVGEGPVELRVGHHALEGLAAWFARAINECDTARGRGGPRRLTVVPAWQAIERRRNDSAAAGVLRLHFGCETPRRDRLKATVTAAGQKTDEETSNRDLSQRETSNRESSNRDSANSKSANRERAEIVIKRLNEPAIGELCAWLSAAKLLYEALR